MIPTRSMLGPLLVAGLAALASAACGDDAFAPSDEPVPAFTALSAGAYHTCAVGVDGSAWCWGANGSGQLGRAGGKFAASPVRVPGDERWTDVSAGTAHTCALGEGRRAWCWGSGRNGRLGNGGTADSPAPVRVNGDIRFLTITAGATQSCGVDVDLHAWCWGGNGLGQVGDSTTTDALVPRRVWDLDAPWTTVAAGTGYSCGTVPRGHSFCWGGNANGQLGSGNIAPSVIPAFVWTEAQFVRVDAGFDHSCGVTAAGEAYCWGSNLNRKLGSDVAFLDVRPRRVDGGFHAVDVAAGLQDHSCAVTAEGTAVCWGNGLDGKLGVPGAGSSTPPTEVPGLAGLTRITAGLLHTCALDADGRAWCWGAGTTGQLGSGSLTARAAPTKVAVR